MDLALGLIATLVHTKFANSDPMQGLPANGRSETVALYGVVLVVFGCLKSWVSPTIISV